MKNKIDIDIIRGKELNNLSFPNMIFISVFEQCKYQLPS